MEKIASRRIMSSRIITNVLDDLMHRPTALTRWLHNPPAIRAMQGLPQKAKVLDVGCYGFRQVEIARRNKRSDLVHFGLDHPHAKIEKVPEGFTYRSCDVDHEPFPFADKMFDLVVATHVLEHIRDPIVFLSECCRVCKPGGVISVETPSERSVFLPGFPFQHEKFMSLSFFDDPTHLGRPWSTQGLYRLAQSLGLTEIHASYDWNLPVALLSPLLIPFLWISKQARAFQYVVWKTVGWNARLLARRPLGSEDGPKFQYFIPHRS